MEPIPDPELVAKVRSGERDAFAELVRRHHPAIMGLCVSMLGDATQAEDAAQEAFLKAYRSLDRFRADSAFSTWVYRIAANHCLDLLRRRARERTQPLDAAVENSAASPPPSLERADLAERVLGRLPPDYRLILTLREAQGLSYEELARTLDVSLDSVKAKLRRARQKLEEEARHLLGPEDV